MKTSNIVGNKFCVTHGMTNTPEYRAWQSLRDRCCNEKHRDYRHYGGRGITVCNRWVDNFESFYKDMGERPSGTSIDRIDNEKGYFPSNCRWADRFEQLNNTRWNKTIEYDGEKMTIAQASRRFGIKYTTLYMRLFSFGWSIEKSLTTK